MRLTRDVLHCRHVAEVYALRIRIGTYIDPSKKISKCIIGTYAIVLLKKSAIVTGTIIMKMSFYYKLRFLDYILDFLVANE